MGHVNFLRYHDFTHRCWQRRKILRSEVLVAGIRRGQHCEDILGIRVVLVHSMIIIQSVCCLVFNPITQLR